MNYIHNMATSQNMQPTWAHANEQNNTGTILFWHSDTFFICLLVFNMCSVYWQLAAILFPPVCCLRFSLRSSNILENAHRKVTGCPIELGQMLEALYPFGRRLLALPINVLISVEFPILGLP